MKRQEVGENSIMKSFVTCSYSSPNIIRIIMSKRMGLEDHVARIGEKGMHIEYLWKPRMKEITRKSKT
jgi:hypothetical protein